MSRFFSLVITWINIIIIYLLFFIIFLPSYDNFFFFFSGEYRSSLRYDQQILTSVRMSCFLPCHAQRTGEDVHLQIQEGQVERTSLRPRQVCRRSALLFWWKSQEFCAFDCGSLCQHSRSKNPILRWFLEEKFNTEKNVFFYIRKAMYSLLRCTPFDKFFYNMSGGKKRIVFE